MVNFDTSFRHDLLQIAIGNRISNIEKHRVQDDIFRILAAFSIAAYVKSGFIMSCHVMFL